MCAQLWGDDYLYQATNSVILIAWIETLVIVIIDASKRFILMINLLF